jgi:hypothetical protein
MAKQTPVTCRECGKRKVKAITTNPITGVKRRSTIKICQECHIKTIDYRFFKSSFGQWLRNAFQRQCTNSIPENTNELRGVLHLWKFYRKACGFNSDGEEVTKAYDYHLCHIDPIKGKDGLIGRLTYSNLMIAPAALNRQHSNLPYPFTSKQSVSKGEPITDDNFKVICRERYDLSLLAAQFCLIPQKRSKSLPVFKSDGVNMSITLSSELKRLGYPVNYIIPIVIEADKLANEVYDTFFKVGGALAVNLLVQHSIPCPNGLIDYDFTLPCDRIKLAKDKVKARKQEEQQPF